MIMSRTFGEVVILFCVSVVIALAVNHFSPDGIPVFGNWDPDRGSLNAGGPCKPGTRELSDDEISAVYIDPGNIFIDARTRGDYEAGHIPGALSYPVGEFESKLAEFTDHYPPDQKYVIYCIGIDCHDSHDLAKLLKDQGYQNISVYPKGYDGWVAAGRPTREGGNP
jgi:rhodanese-related sulfurtransferase